MAALTETPMTRFALFSIVTLALGIGANAAIFSLLDQVLIQSLPVANPDLYAMNQDTTLNVGAPGVLGNDSDPNGDSITATLVSDVSNGTLALSADGSFTYEPGPGFVGDDTFTYNASDGTDDSNTETVTIHVADTPGVSMPMAPIAANGLVFIGNAGGDQTGVTGHVYALDARDGPDPELVVFLQATSPVRRAGDIDRAISTLRAAGADSLFSARDDKGLLWSLDAGIPRSLNWDFGRRRREQEMGRQGNPGKKAQQEWRCAGDRFVGPLSLRFHTQMGTDLFKSHFDLWQTARGGWDAD